MDIEKLKHYIDIDRIFTEIDTFVLSEDKYQDQLNDEYLSLQICLQGTDEDMDPYFGSRRMNTNFSEEDFNVFLFPELDYTNAIIYDLKMVRTRIMLMKPKTCYYWHNDKTKRYHIPIQTHEHCWLLLNGKMVHLPADGTAYIVDTTLKHTALYCSKVDRIHIVGALH